MTKDELIQRGLQAVQARQRKDTLNQFAVSLRAARKKAGLSQTELGKAIGVTMRSIQLYEKQFDYADPMPKKRAFPPFDTVLKTAAVCKVPLRQLVPSQYQNIKLE